MTATMQWPSDNSFSARAPSPYPAGGVYSALLDPYLDKYSYYLLKGGPSSKEREGTGKEGE